MKKALKIFRLAAVASLLAAGGVSAATFVVNSTASGVNAGDCIKDPTCTLEGAIEAANSTIEFDTIDATGITGTVILSQSVQIAESAEVLADGLVVDGGGVSTFRLAAPGVTVSGFEFVNTAGVIVSDSATLSNNVVRDTAATVGLLVNTLEPATVTNNHVFGTTGSFEIYIQGTGHIVEDNVFGIDESGSMDSELYGVFITRVIDLTFNSNSVAGSLDAVFVRGALDSTFMNNRMGNFDGSSGNGSSRYGFHLNSAENIALSSNITSGHGEDGLIISGSSSNVEVTGHISTDNGGRGIFVDSGATANLRGVTVTDNSTGFATATGGSIFSQGSVSNNADLGIDIGADGLTPNGGNDTFTDTPVINTAAGGISMTVDGSLVEAPESDFVVEFYVSDVCGSGNGETYLDSINLATGMDGTAPFTVSFDTAIAAGKFLTATATGPNGTSEFSGCVEVIANPIFQDRFEFDFGA